MLRGPFRGSLPAPVSIDRLAAPYPGFLEAVVQHIAHPIFVKDRTHKWIWVNDAFAALVGKPREELLGTTDSDYFPEAQAEYFYAKDRECLAGNVVHIEEEPITVEGGQLHWLTTTKVPLRGPDGEVTHLVGIIHDITRLKTIEEDLRSSRAEMEKRIEERARELKTAQNALLRKERLVVLGQLTGGLAHQIRTPLTAISNAAAVVRRKLGSAIDPDTQTALAILNEEVWEANRIITDLIDFARVRPPSSMEVAVDKLVDLALAAVPSVEGIDVVKQIPAGLRAWVDERQMRDALANVIRNGYEAMCEQGELTIIAAHDGASVLISIRDNGPGLGDDAASHLFEPLLTTKALGLGLGLPTAKALIENQGGSILYAGKPGAGACFEIRIPIDDPSGPVSA